jgi:chromate reductase, NAD(P)H dehydrogenase (quinone)
MSQSGPLRIVSLCGSLRRASFNAGLQRALPGLAPPSLDIEPLQGLAHIPLYDGDVEAQGFPRVVEKMAEAIRAADGLIICTPEYNNSVPGVLKNAIDWLSRLPQQPFNDKPVALQSASPGAFGGVRCQLALRPILATLNAHVLNRPGVLVTQARAKFDAQTGDLTDEETKQQIAKQLAAFETFVRRLQPR